MIAVRLCLALIIATAIVGSAWAQQSPWAKFRTPSAGPSRSLGAPAAGCLAGGVALPFDGPGFEVIHVSRDRYFGNARTVAFIEALGQRAQAASLSPFYVGDLSLPRGGPMPNGHASHQTGLDVDVWFNLEPKPVLAPAAREDVSLPSMVLPGGKAIDAARFGEAQVRLLRLAATDPAVDRIFVNPAIKRALCEGLAGAGNGDRAWLHRIRPWYGHDDHFHVRLSCPSDSTACTVQAPVPAGDGCDASLAWWFEPHPSVSPPPSPRRRAPILPAACRKLLEP